MRLNFCRRKRTCGVYIIRVPYRNVSFVSLYALLFLFRYFCRPYSLFLYLNTGNEILCWRRVRDIAPQIILKGGNFYKPSTTHFLSLNFSATDKLRDKKWVVDGL